MSTFLWDKTVFGPICSRRLGSSLGINVSPTDVKICSFDCIYCECGWTFEKSIDLSRFLKKEEIQSAIEAKLKQCQKDAINIDSITFSGNGEPTLHPQFDQIIDALMVLRDNYYPNTAISCLSNATQLGNEKVRSALQKIENPILKLDAVIEPMFHLVNSPIADISVDEIIKNLTLFEGNFILQTMFLKGEIRGSSFNNAAEPHLSLWLKVVKQVNPRKVMLYSLERNTPEQRLEKISMVQLQEIALIVKEIGVEANAY